MYSIFDLSCLSSNFYQGTLPYMSIELLQAYSNNTISDFVHRIDHDLESLFLVFLHIVRFTYGPSATEEDKICSASSQLFISQWHHETLTSNLPFLKRGDIDHILRETMPEKLVVKYWAPVAPFLKRFIDIIYTKGGVLPATSHGIAARFRETLVAVLDVCRDLEEKIPNYGACPTKKRKPRRSRAAAPKQKKHHSQSG